ncbi:MAG: Type I secretion membrane fusion protein HlyD family [Rhodospirillaceae bacterium]|nr:MAG: Type I secretion membrane fusion protein HlyD family [Rhodospirillaceae bacterium]
MATLEADILRLAALLKNAESLRLPADVMRDAPELAAQTMERFMAQKRRHESEIRKQMLEIEQRRKEILETESKVTQARRTFSLPKEKITISDSLLKDNLTNRLVHIDLLKEASSLEGQITSGLISLDRAQAALRAVEAGLQTLRTIFEEENLKAIDENRLKYSELKQRRTKFEDSLKRTVLTAPVDGVIKRLRVATVGGVIRPGDPIVEVVPADDTLIVEAKLPTQDIGYVTVGQTSMLKLASADAGRFGGIKGTVISVSPDKLVTPDGQLFYLVRIGTDIGYFQHGNMKYHLVPGVQVVANIRIGQRTVLNYLLDPIQVSLADALHER